MRKIILTAAVAMTVFMMMTGYQAKPAGGNGQTTQVMVEQTAEEQITTAAKEISLDEIHVAVEEVYGENYVPSAAFDEQGMKELFGINNDLYDSFITEGLMISVHMDTFVAVRTRKGKGEEVAQHLNSYRDSQLSNAIQYPMNLPKIEVLQVVRHGSYVFSVTLGISSEEVKAQGKEAVSESAKENIQVVIDVIDGYFVS